MILNPRQVANFTIGEDGEIVRHRAGYAEIN